MPAPEVNQLAPSMTHVNLMIDTFIANASPEDLRAICRGILASGSPEAGILFTNIARARVRQINMKTPTGTKQPFFIKGGPTPALKETLSRARATYGCGMGFASLPILTEVVRGTIGQRWDQDAKMIDTLADVDTDITQAIQSCKEELEAGRIENYAKAREVVDRLRLAVDGSHLDVESWMGDFPFQRARSSIEYWKL